MPAILTFRELAKRIICLPLKQRQRIIAIDGGGGAGKTTFASCLQEEISDSCIVHVDDFYRPPQLRTPLVSTNVINPNFDWDRLRTLILEAVQNDQDVRYQLYDFKTGTLSGKSISIPRDATIIVEGVWSLQKAFVDLYDFCIWLEAPAAIRLERGVSREGEGMRQIWEDEWIPIDDYYQKTEEPHRRADCIVDNVSSDFQQDKIVIL